MDRRPSRLIRNFYANLVDELGKPNDASLDECVDRAIDRLFDPEKVAYADCSICKGTGTHIGGDEEVPCSTCRLRARAEDRIRAAAEDATEAAYKNAGFGEMSPLEQWHADGAR